MKTRLLLYLFLLCAALQAHGQVQLRGLVRTSDTKEGIPLASILLTSLRDSTRTQGAVADLEGHYSLDKLRVGSYRLEIRSTGYKTLSKTIRITMPSGGFAVERIDELEPAVIETSQLIVEGKRRSQTADRRVLSFEPQTVKEALHSYDLLKTLPMIKVDMMHDRLQGALGGAVQVLINGNKATKAEVLMIPKHKIKQVEVYDIPPARYQSVELVLNIITSNLQTGYIVGGELNHALQTGFGNDLVYGSLIRGKHKLSLEYALNYRDYDNRENKVDYSYTLASKAHQLSYLDRGHFGYTTHSPRLKYAFVPSERTILEATLKPSFETRFDYSTGKGFYAVAGETTKQLSRSSDNKINLQTPSLDLYLWRKLDDKRELSLNLVGTMFRTTRDLDSKEDNLTDTQPMFRNQMHLDNDKYSLIGEAAYTQQLSFARWSSGYRGEIAALSSKVQNQLGHLDYRSRFLTQYAYSELSGATGRWLYRISLGLTHIHSQSDKVRHDQLAFTPHLVLGYTLRPRHTLRLVYKHQTGLPDINSLSSNRTFVSRDILSVGNPSLLNALSHQLSSVYTYQGKYADLNLIGIAVQTNRPHITEAIEEGGRYLMRSVNGRWERSLGGALSANIRPLGDARLSMKLLLAPIHTELRSTSINYRHMSWTREFGLNWQSGGLTLGYQYSIPDYNVSQGYASLSEQQHSAQIGYRLGAWRLSASLLFIGTSAHYHNYSLGTPLLQVSDERWIHNNKNMITLGVAYHFGTGEDRSYSKQLNNADSSAPIL